MRSIIVSIGFCLLLLLIFFALDRITKINEHKRVRKIERRFIRWR